MIKPILNVFYKKRSIYCFYFLIFSTLILQSGFSFAQENEKDTVNNSKPNSLSDSLNINILPYSNKTYPVLYRDKKPDEIISPIGFVKGNRLEKMPTANLTNTFAGLFAGLSTIQNSGEPGNDFSSLNLRGRNPLILIDGVPRDILSINPEQIESITVLKDALSTAMLGVRGMNGAILIKTRTKSSDNSILSFTAQTGIQSSLKTQTPLGAFEYASLYNEALVNDGKAAFYSSTDLEAYRTGSNPFRFPNVNWRDALLKDQAPYNKLTLNVSGDAFKSASYFVSLDYLNQDGLLKENDNNNYSTNNSYKRYQFRSNLNVNIDKKTIAYINVLGNIQTSNRPGTSVSQIFNNILTTPNNAYPIYNYNGSFGGNRQFSNNLYAQSTSTGYIRDENRVSYIDFGLKRDLTKDLWAKASATYNSAIVHRINRSKSFEVYETQILNVDTTYKRYNTKTNQGNSASVLNNDQQFYSEFSLGYDKELGQNNLNGIFLASRDAYQSGNQLSSVFNNISGRLSYMYHKRYQLEVAGSYSGNNFYSDGMGYGFFPSAGLSWNIQNEPFMIKNFPKINQLKLSASYGKVGGVGNGNSMPGYFLYLEKYGNSNSYFFGNTPVGSSGLEIGSLAEYISYEKSNKLDIGLHLQVLDQKLTIEVDYYQNRNYDLLQRPGNNSSLYGIDLPRENIGINRYSGLETSGTWTSKVGNVSYSISGNLSTRDSKVIFNDEPLLQNYLTTTGGQVGQIRGLIATGFYNGSLPAPASTVTTEGYLPFLKKGDVLYKDLNNDGVINQFDITDISSSKPLVFYGADLALAFKKFDLSVLVQGVSNYNINLSGSPLTTAFQNNGAGQAYESSLNRWTPETATTATLPRLSIGSNRNNDRLSTLYVQEANYLRLKNAELGYSINNTFLSKNHIKGIRVFVNGINLLTTSSYKDADPESNDGAYPIQRIINGGVNIKF